MLALREVIQLGDEYLDVHGNWVSADKWQGDVIGFEHTKHRRRTTFPESEIPIDPPANGVQTLKDSGQPLFEQRANATIRRVQDTFSQRGSEYGDTWRNCQWLVLKATADQLKDRGVVIPPDCLRAIAVAAYIDMKYQRFEGGYKEDNTFDGIAYGAFHADEMRELKEGK